MGKRLHSMSKRNEHLVVIVVEPAPKGEFTAWLLHITIVPWFPAFDLEKLDKVLAKVAAKHEAFDAKVGHVEEWGGKDTFKVNDVESPGNLHRLHWDVFHSLEKNGFPVHQKEHLGSKYRPHFIHKRHHIIPVGETIPIISFVLVRQVRLKKTGTMIKEIAKEYFLQ